jgi:hypothetical protein
MAVLLFAIPSLAAVKRYALVIGNDHGDASDVALQFAETDAQRVYDVLKDLGGFEPADMVLLRGETATRAQATLISLNDRIRTAIASGSEGRQGLGGGGGEGAGGRRGRREGWQRALRALRALRPCRCREPRHRQRNEKKNRGDTEDAHFVIRLSPKLS